jgi:CheY-like chemotaxis protein
MKTILIIDDQECVRELLRDVLEGAGYRVLQADSGHEGLRQALMADLILLDEQMPGMSGSQTVKLLKVAPATATIPILMMSGGGIQQVVPVSGYVNKPCSPAELLQKLEQVLNPDMAESGLDRGAAD